MIVRERIRTGRTKLTPAMAGVRSAVTNGTRIIKDLDGRSAWARRLRDLLANHASDLGGVESLSEAQLAIIRRASMLQLQCELLEQRFAENDGAATSAELESYQRVSNSLRRLLETLGLTRGRRARDITEVDPLTYARQHADADHG